MNLRDLKYLLALIIPALAILCALDPKHFYYQTVIFGLVVVPLLDLVIPASHDNNLNESERDNIIVFDILLYLNFPILFFTLFYGLHQLMIVDLTKLEQSLTLFSFGILLGTSGLNVAHEVGHRDGNLAQWISRLLLMPGFYIHFNIDHYYGHHKNVGTPEDPVTALKNQPVYLFWFQSIFGGYRGAWKHEKKRIARLGLATWQNKMIWFHLMMLGYLLCIYFLFGILGLIYSFIIALSAVLLVETANYVEHYGMQRKKLKNGRYEAVQIHHSWNTDREIGRIVLYELTRHSDHHDKATRKYQNLKTHIEAPKLPLSLVASLFVALIPPLWYRMMNERIPT